MPIPICASACLRARAWSIIHMLRCVRAHARGRVPAFLLAAVRAHGGVPAFVACVPQGALQRPTASAY